MITPNHPLLALSLEFMEICRPLELVQIEHVTYMKTFVNGGRTILSTKPRWIEDYYNLNLYKSSLFESDPKQYQAGFNVWTGDYDLEVYQHGRLYYNTAHSITVTEPVPDGCEHFLFSTSPNNAHVIHYLANNMDILYHFILYCKDRGLQTLQNATEKRVVLPNEDINTSQPLINIDVQTEMHELKEQFYKHTPVHHYQTNNTHITQRELQILFYLLHHKTADETAQQMNISRRTAESYIENLKNKLGCSSKAELILKLKNERLLLSLYPTS